jgi:hypothetical protein
VHAIIVIEALSAVAGDDKEGEETSPLQDVPGGDGRGAVSAPNGPAVPTLSDAARGIEGGEETSPLQGVPDGGDGVSIVESQIAKPTLGQIVGYYKYETAKQINLLRGMPGIPFWQRNYWEHIIRNEASRDRIRQYIKNNPGQWEKDQLHPGAPPNRFNRWQL